VTAKARIGRPPLPDGEVREVVFTLRLSVAEREAIVAAGQLSGKHPTTWARDTLLASAGVVNSINARSGDRFRP
jgi:hypothetical protein